MTKALVLSGGGPVGIAWQTGIAAGLAVSGVDLRTADFILGTSAGSLVGAQIALGRDLAGVFERYRAKVQPPSVGAVDAVAESGTGTRASFGASGPMAVAESMMARALDEGRTPEEARAAVGRFALDADTQPEKTFINSFRYLRGEGWPPRFACTAVDAETGEFVVWNAENSTELERAVASSCALPGIFPPVWINNRRYIDGGLRSPASADLAVGYDFVLILTLRRNVLINNPSVERARRRIPDDPRVLLDAGSTVFTIAPDDLAARALGSNPHDSTVSPAAAAAGFRQGEAEAEQLRAIWC